MTPKQKTVSFTCIEVVELPMILGDHPSCRAGPPVQTSWDAQSRESYSLDEYEQSRSPRRSLQEMHLSCETRREIVSGLPPPLLDDDASSCCSSADSSPNPSPRSRSRRSISDEKVEQLLLQVTEKVDQLMTRMSLLDENLFESSRKRRSQRRELNRARRRNLECLSKPELC